MEIVNGRWDKSAIAEAAKFINRNHRGKHKQVIEFGVYRGESLRLIQECFYAYQMPLERAYGVDAFQGLPEEAPGVDRFWLFEPGMFSDTDRLCNFRDPTFMVRKWFRDLTPADAAANGMGPMALIHFDGDLYVSARDAMKFVYENGLAAPGTVLVFDEFRSTELTAGGESKAHVEAVAAYGVGCRELYRNVYFDRVECWQNCFEVLHVGGEPRHGIHGEPELLGVPR